MIAIGYNNLSKSLARDWLDRHSLERDPGKRLGIQDDAGDRNRQVTAGQL